MQRTAIWLITAILLLGATRVSELELYAAKSDSAAPTLANNGERWRLFSDRVMGGVSSGTLTADTVEGRPCLRMQGQVSLENNGGFIQIAIDLGDSIQKQLPSYTGIALDVYGNAERYNVHLRTEGMRRPWQSYRSSFGAEAKWQTVSLPFSAFTAYRVETGLNVATIRRLGIVAIGRDFKADLCVGRVVLLK
ncbi:MAG: CIA30 family protein [Pseudomonadota bacterium]